MHSHSPYTLKTNIKFSLSEQRASTTPVQGPLLGSAEEAPLSEVHAEDALARLLVLELDVGLAGGRPAHGLSVEIKCPVHVQCSLAQI